MYACVLCVTMCVFAHRDCIDTDSQQAHVCLPFLLLHVYVVHIVHFITNTDICAVVHSSLSPATVTSFLLSYSLSVVYSITLPCLSILRHTALPFSASSLIRPYSFVSHVSHAATSHPLMHSISHLVMLPDPLAFHLP